MVQGLGTEGDDLSHFSMLARWWRGDSDAHATGDTGFLGRCCDQLSLEQPIVGLSLGRGASPALQSEKAPTVSLPLLDAIQGMGEADNRDSQALRTGFELLTKGDKYDSAQISWARQGLTDLLGMVDVLRELPPQPEPPYPGGELGQELMRAARLIRADAGMRIIHIPWGDFDTHEGQRGRHDGLMNQFGNSVAAFMADLAKDGRAGDVLVATTSEFGRRPASNSSGTDHGGASVAMLVGPVVAGRHGQAPSLRQFDRHDNLVTTTTMSEYYATLASWFGIPASDVLSNATNVKPLAGMLA